MSTHALIPPPLSLYVHLPWCTRKCPYCDFNSYHIKTAAPFEAYIDALLRDLDLDVPLVWGRSIQSLFFGGGTPSLFPATAIERFIHEASQRLRFAPNIEITLEANPGTTEYVDFHAYRRAGVNRLSFGIQSFDDHCLRRLERIHTAEEAQTAIKRAQDAGFDNINLDLMFALPGQTLALAQHDIEQALQLQPQHISHYQLTLEPQTRFFAKPPRDLPDDDTAADIQEQSHARLTEAGFTHYETSAYALEGRQCRHNLNYWRFGDYLGLGAGAHGKLTLAAEHKIVRRWKIRHPEAYLGSAGCAESIAGHATVAQKDLPFEFMLNALRLHEGFLFEDFEFRTGLMRSVIESPLSIARARAWLTVSDTRVTPTVLGRRFANDVISLFILPDITLYNCGSLTDNRRSGAR